jgi:opacity protein-like surface antigen
MRKKMNIKYSIPPNSLLLLFLLISLKVSAQNNRAQIPPLLHNTYFEVKVGYIQYPFGRKQVENGYTFQSVKIPHTAVNLAIMGYDFNKYLSAQISYMRPVLWVNYTYNTGSPESEMTRAVWMNVAGLTIKPNLPIGNHFSVFGEGGLAIITRKGFNDQDGIPIIKNANYATFMFGGGLKYQFNGKWGLILNAVHSPENTKAKQPATSLFSAGFSYKLLPFTEKQLERTAKAAYIFPGKMIQIGFTSNVLGYGVNNFFAEGKVPVFWGGEAEVRLGLSVSYQQNVFHGIRVFSLDWGANISYWQSNENKEKFFTLSLYPVLRWTFLRTKPADVYFYYVVAGPTYISKVTIDGKDLGKHFTFLDNMGSGIFFGKDRNLNAEVKIGHYSNGDIFPGNEGVKIPLSLNLGYTF